MNILITGASGFIGQNLVESFLKDGFFNIITLDLKPSTHKTKHYCLDVCDYDSLLSITEPIDVIYHLAAQSYGRGSFEEPEKDVDWNIKGTLNITRFGKLQKVKKIVYSSTMAVYGNNAISYERDYPEPLSNYGVSKLAGEFYIKKSNIPYVIFRLYNTYGRYQDLSNHSKGVVLAFTSQVALGVSNIRVTGALERFRDIIHVTDVVNALKLGLNSETTNQIFNVSTNIKTTIGDLINSILKASNRTDVEVTNVGGLPGDQFGNTGNSDKLQALGWQPQTKLDEGIVEFYKYVKKHINE